MGYKQPSRSRRSSDASALKLARTDCEPSRSQTEKSAANRSTRPWPISEAIGLPSPTGRPPGQPPSINREASGANPSPASESEPANGTTGCTVKYATGDDVIKVAVARTTTIVCAGGGPININININIIASPDHAATRFWVAFGAGDEAVIWNLPLPTELNDGVKAIDSQMLIIRPKGTEVRLGAENQRPSKIVSGANAQFKTTLDWMSGFPFVE
jgi:hypothetical protein